MASYLRKNWCPRWKPQSLARRLGGWSETLAGSVALAVRTKVPSIHSGCVRLKPEKAMNVVGKVGVVLTFVGFLAVGSAALYGANASPASNQDAVQVAKNVGMAQGFGWIVAGVGFAMSFQGLSTDLHDSNALGSEHLRAGPVSAPSKVREVPKAKPEFVCSDCGGVTSLDATSVLPFCAPFGGGERRGFLPSFPPLFGLSLLWPGSDIFLRPSSEFARARLSK